MCIKGNSPDTNEGENKTSITVTNTPFKYINVTDAPEYVFITPTRILNPICMNCKGSELEVHDCSDIGCFLHPKKIIPLDEVEYDC
jgi:hypothetical protein